MGFIGGMTGRSIGPHYLRSPELSPVLAYLAATWRRQIRKYGEAPPGRCLGVRDRHVLGPYADPVTSSGVGTLKETHLHAALKQWCAQPGDRLEVPVGRFVVDIVRGEQLIEIQTRSFSSMRGKLDALLDEHPIHIVHPIAGRKWIVRGPHAGKPAHRRKSPKVGCVHDVFAELVSFPSLIDHPNLSLEVLITDQEEVRRFDGNTSWRRKGWAVVERRLLEVTDRLSIDSPNDLTQLLPPELPESFTTADLAAGIQRPQRLGQQMAYCLRGAGVIEISGKRGNALQYRKIAV
jgi:hypothetical protein